jgi:uncharacterized protein with HEPN domain
MGWSSSIGRASRRKPSGCSDAGIAEPRARLEHILFHIDGVAETVGGLSFDTFTTVYYLERTVERGISEAIKALPPELLAAHPHVEWQKIISIGNLLRDEYYRVDPRVMWDIAVNRLPELRPVIETMLDEARKAGGE